jgi:hypothetical protein
MVAESLCRFTWLEAAETRCDENVRLVALRSPEQKIPNGRLWYAKLRSTENAIGYAMHSSRSHDAVIRVYDEDGNVIETHEHASQLKEC